MELDSDFEDDLRQAALEAAAEDLMGPGSPVMTAVKASQDLLSSHDYEGMDSIADTLVEPELDREGDTVRVTWGWTHEAAEYFEFGTSDHEIQGNPVLAFVWEGAPPDVRWSQGDGSHPNPKTFFQSVEVSGVDEIRFTRAGLDLLRRHLEAR